MGPFAVEASTAWPPCVMWTAPEATRRRAAARAGSISGSHWLRSSEAATARAASEGQIVLSRPRAWRRARIIASSAASTSAGFWERQASEQNLTLSQSRSHFLRQVMMRPQVAQVLKACSPETDGDLGLGSGMAVVSV